MDILVTLLNLPWSLIGIFTALLALPKKVEISKNPPAIIFYIHDFWWYKWIPRFKKVRGITNGNIIQVNNEADKLDIKHELIHVEQNMRYPLISGFVFGFEQIIHGFGPEKNRFEQEAYKRSGSRYLNKDHM